jgi:ADP-ribose pyrophosphatase YjhB (NUDIX family)
MIKILYNEKRIFLAPDAAGLIRRLGIRTAHVQYGFELEKFLLLLDALSISETDQGIIEGDPEILLQQIRENLVPVVAAGGVVINPRHEVLFIFRRKRWDLPKGKMDPGETIETCAVREVREETGVQNPVILEPITQTHHIYLEGQLYFKTTHWFLMNADETRLRPQKLEGISKAMWIPQSNIHQQLSKTYESVRDIFRALNR